MLKNVDFGRDSLARWIANGVVAVALVASSLVGNGGGAYAEASGSTANQSILADYAGTIRESVPRVDGIKHVDTPRMIERLKKAHVTTYYYLVWYTPTEWQDLTTEFVPAAEAAGIDVWVYLVPPSECCSEPYRTDYVAWGDAIGALAAAHPNVRGWAIDDFRYNLTLFTPNYITAMQSAARAKAPWLEFMPLVYAAELTPLWVEQYGAVIDGVIFAFRDDPYRNTQVVETLPGQLDTATRLLDPLGKKVVLMVYASALSTTVASPSADYVAAAVKIGLDYAADGRIAGVTTYVLPKTGSPEPSNTNVARTGSGRLSFTSWTTVPGTSAQATQTIAVPGGSGPSTLSFWHGNQFQITPRPGAGQLQVLVDSSVVWSQDLTAGGAKLNWSQSTVDLTAALAGKEHALLTIRVLELTTSNQVTATTIDDVDASGLKVFDGGFEGTHKWSLSRTSPNNIPEIVMFDPARAAHVYQVVRVLYAKYSGKYIK